jgi:histidine triad (HIT) family protein
MDSDCLFCKIALKQEPAFVVWENEEFIAIKNKYPKAPVHLLVIPKKHVSKKGLVSGSVTFDGFWDRIMGAVFEVIVLKKLDKNGYKLVNNGAPYNHFDHEHIHIMGGTKTEPGGES